MESLESHKEKEGFVFRIAIPTWVLNRWWTYASKLREKSKTLNLFTFAKAVESVIIYNIPVKGDIVGA